MPEHSIHRDETPMQSAERAADAISTFVALVALRAVHGPLDHVPDEELAAFGVMRNALHELASHEYDRGYRRAIALRKPAPATGPTAHAEED